MKVSVWILVAAAIFAGCSVADAAAVPEIDAGSGLGAISVLLGALALVAERRRKGNSAK